MVMNTSIIACSSDVFLHKGDRRCCKPKKAKKDQAINLNQTKNLSHKHIKSIAYNN